MSVNLSWTRFLPRPLRVRLEGRLQLQRILSNVAWLSIDKIVRLGVGMIVGVWMARYLGPTQFGLFNYAAAFVLLFSPLATLGLETIVVRDIIRDSQEKQMETLGTAFLMRLIGSTFAAVLAFVTILLVRPNDALSKYLVAIAAAGFIFQSLDVIDFWFQSFVRSKYAVYARNTAFILMSLVRVALILLRAPLIAFAWAALGELFLSALGLVIVYAKNHGNVLRWKASIGRAIRFFKDSWPLIFAGLAVLIYMRIGQVMVVDLLDDRSVGIFSVAVKLVEIWYFIPISIVASVFPSILRAKQESEQLYLSRMQSLYDLMSAISIPVAVVTTFLARPVVVLLYGPQYSDAGPVLALYVWASVPVFLGIASGQQLLIENFTRLALFRSIAGGVTNVALNLVLIHSYGTIGAALAALASFIVATFIIIVDKDLFEQVIMMFRSLNPLRLIRIAVEQGRTSTSTGR